MTVKFYNGMEITATMTMLNEISADYVEKEVMMAMKKEYRKKSNEIYDALYNIGFYDEL